MKAAEEKTNPETKKAPSSQKKKSQIKKLSPDACKLLQTLSERANKKAYGRKIRDGDIIALALSLIQSKHIEELQEQSLTEKDRLARAHEEYQKAHGKVTLDQFIGKLIRGEISAQPQK